MSDAKTSGDKTSPFRQAASSLRSAAVAYSERVYDTGEPMLRRAFVDAARQFRAYLETLNGSVVARAEHDTKPMFDKCVSVLSAEGVSQAFGLPAAPPQSWPFLSDFGLGGQYLNGDAACLMEEISRVLPPLNGLVDQQQFLARQRAAGFGGRTIKLVLEEKHLEEKNQDPEDGLVSLIGDAYTWSTALRDLGGVRT